MASSRSRCSYLAFQIFDRTGQKFNLDFSVQIFVRLVWFRVNGTSKRTNFDRSKIRPVPCEARGLAKRCLFSVSLDVSRAKAAHRH